MDSCDKQEYEEQPCKILDESLTSQGRVSAHELEFIVVLPATGGGNPKVGAEVLTQLVREILERIFQASLEKTKEVVQGRSVECRNKRGRSPSNLEPRSVKHFKSQHIVSTCIVEGSGSDVDVSICGHCKKPYPGECKKN